MTDSMRHGKAVQATAPVPYEKGPERASRKTPDPVRFARHYGVDENGCWVWTGQRNPKGYGLFNDGSRTKWRAHRWSYTHKYGPIPEGLVLDHYVCDNPSCVNPDHVRPVTTRENLLRSDKTHAARNAAKTHCDRAGHELPLAGGQWRKCRQCKRPSRARRRKAAGA